MAEKRASEKKFQAAAHDPAPWQAISSAEQKFRPMAKQAYFRTVRPTFAETAVDIVRYVEQVTKPDSERLPGFHDAQLQSLRYQLLSPAPVYLNLQKTLLTTDLREAQQQLGPNDTFVKAALNGAASPEAAADAAFQGTKMTDPAVRKALLEGGVRAVQASQDPLVKFALRVEPVLRETTEWVRAEEQLGKDRFAIYGKSIYPDATFTLRLAYGSVKGYPMNGTVAPPKTTFYGLYNRADGFDGKAPFNLTPRFADGRNQLNLATPLNFVNTCDIIGGNSGSPVINRNGELVGLIFDGNIESLVGAFVYDERTNRAVAVHPAAMLEALRKLYQAGALANELESGSGSAQQAAR